MLLLSEVRKKKGLSQEKLAKMIDVSKQTIYNWEDGKCCPDAKMIVELCKALSCKVSDIVVVK